MTWHEVAAWFGPNQSMFGILSIPPRPGDVPGVILMNPGTLHRVGGVNLNVRVARAVAKRGLPSLRFDISGLGDSEVRTDGLSYRESTVADLVAAMDELALRAGCSRFLLIGHCTGAAMSYQAALVDRRVAGLVQIEGFAYRTRLYSYHRWKRILLNRHNWTALISGKKNLRVLARLALQKVGILRPEPSSNKEVEALSFAEARNQIRGLADLLPPQAEMREGLSVLLARGVRMLHIYGGGEHHYYSYRRQFLDAFPGLDTRGLVEVEYLASANHYFSSPGHQQWIDARLLDWASGIPRVD